MAVTHGKSTKIYIGAYDLSSVLSEVEVSSERAEAENTAFTNTAKSFLLGHRSGEFSASGNWDGAAGKTDVQFNTQMNGTKVPVTVVWTGTTPTENGFVAAAGGNMAQTQYDMGGGVGDVVPVEVSGRLDGGAAFGACLELDKTRTALGTSVETIFPEAAANPNSWLANLHATSVTAMTTFTCLVKVGTAEGTWGTTLTTFSNVTGVTSECKTGTSTALWRYAVADVTVFTGTSITYTVMLARMA